MEAELSETKQRGVEWHGQTSAAEAHKLMFEQQIFCDVTFHFVPQSAANSQALKVKEDDGVVDVAVSQSLSAHRYMLSARSPVFYNMFYGNTEQMKQKTCSHEITDYKLNDFRQLLRFVYYEEVSLSEENIVSLLSAATNYQIIPLRTRCVEFLRTLIDVNHVCFVLEQALDFYEQTLAQLCLGYIKRNTKAVLQTKGFLDMKNATLEKLLSSPALGVAELELFEHVILWAQHQCSTTADQCQPAELRRVLGDAVFHVRFPTMKLEDFSAKVAQLGILTTEELVQIYGIFTRLPSEIPDASPCFFSTKPRDTSGISLIVPHSDFKIRMLAAGTNYIETFNATVDRDVHIKSVLLFVGLGTSNPVTGTIQVLQDSVLYGPTAFNCQSGAAKYPTEAHQFPVGVSQLGSVGVNAGFFQLIVTYTTSSSSVPLLVGKQHKSTIVCDGVTFESHVTDGPLCAIEFSA